MNETSAVAANAAAGAAIEDPRCEHIRHDRWPHMPATMVAQSVCEHCGPGKMYLCCVACYGHMAARIANGEHLTHRVGCGRQIFTLPRVVRRLS